MLKKRGLVFFTSVIMLIGNCANVMAEDDVVFVDGFGTNITDTEGGDLGETMKFVQSVETETEKGSFSDSTQTTEKMIGEITVDSENMSGEVVENSETATGSAQNLEIEAEKETALDLMQDTESINEEVIIDNSDEDDNILEIESENDFIEEISIDNIQTNISKYNEDTQIFSGAGEGTKSSPYIVSNTQQLNEIRYNLSAYYILDSDIELSDIPNWNPIGDETAPFSGNLDGRNHIINGLTIDTEELDYVGLFGSCSDAIIKNVNLKNVSIKVDKKNTDYTEGNSSGNAPANGSVHVGALVAHCASLTTGADIENCTAHGSISVVNCYDANVGGIVSDGGLKKKISGCINYVNIYVLSNRKGYWGNKNDGEVNCGGIVGSGNVNNVSSCENYGNIEVMGCCAYCGGICGDNVFVDTCTNYGNISGQVQSATYYDTKICSIGGITGHSSYTIQYCVNYGNISSSANEKYYSCVCAGGIAGYTGGEIAHCINMGESIEAFDMRENQVSLTYAQDSAARISTVASPITECYSLDTVKVNGTLPTSNIGTDQIHGESLSLDDIQQVIKNNYAGNSMVISTFPSNGENNVNPKLYGEGYDITVCFDGVVTAGEGYISIINLNTDEVLLYDVGVQSSVVLEESVLTIPSVHLDYGSIYSIQFDAGCVYVDGKKFFGLSGEGDWTFTTRNRINLSTDTWEFKNFIGCEKKYWQLWFPELQAEELSKCVKASNGGVCYGMVMSAMALNSNDQSAPDFSANLVESIKKNSTSKSLGISATDYIRYMFPIQCGVSQDAYSHNLNGLYNDVKAFENGESAGIEIAVYGKVRSDNHAGHSLWGIRTIDEDNISKIVVYDCNHPNEERYIILNKDNNGKFISWNYDMGISGASTFGTGQEGEPEIKYIKWGYTFYDLLKNKLMEVKSSLPVSFSDKNLVALSSGKLITSGVSKIELNGVIEQSEEEAAKVIDDKEFYWNGNNSAQITGGENGLNASFIGIDSSVEITASKGKSTTLTLSDKNSFQMQTVSGDNVNVGFSLLENKGTIVKTQIEGLASKESVSAFNTKGGTTIINGFSEISVDFRKEVEKSDDSIAIVKEKEIYIDNLNADNDYNILTEIADDEVRIVISKDNDGDGIFETEIASTDKKVQEEHKWSEWKIIKQPTVLAQGEQQRTCSICGKVEQQDIAKLKPTIKLNASSIKLKTKQSTKKIKVTGLAKGDSVKSWKSSNTKLVKVNSKGKITARSKTGKATITVTLKSGLSKQITVKVQKKAVDCTKVTLNKASVSLKKGSVFILKPTINPITCVKKVKYTSSNRKVATVTRKGKVVAKKKGKATITVMVGKKKAKCKVTVE